MTIPAGVDRDKLDYGYIPTQWICTLFVVLFGITTLIHLGQSLYFKTWWALPTIVLGGIGEVIGWSGRLWSSHTYLGNGFDPYLMQICATIISPTPLLAANFITLGVLITYLGQQFSRLTPKWYTIIFLSADIVALIVQAVGGASASSALNKPNGNPTPGGHIMLAGIVFQLFVIIVFSSLASEYFYRFFHDKPVRGGFDSYTGAFDRRIQLMVGALAFTTLCLFIRSVYRTIELADGWIGRIIHTEVYFNVLDGMMILLAFYTYNFFHPGFLLKHIYKSRAAAATAAQGSQSTLSQPGFQPSAPEKKTTGNNATSRSRSMRAV